VATAIAGTQRNENRDAGRQRSKRLARSPYRAAIRVRAHDPGIAHDPRLLTQKAGGQSERVVVAAAREGLLKIFIWWASCLGECLAVTVVDGEREEVSEAGGKKIGAESSARIPESNRAIVAGRCQRISVGTERHADYGVGVTGERLADRAARRWIPETDGLVGAA
jgi:hypothetical protein